MFKLSQKLSLRFWSGMANLATTHGRRRANFQHQDNVDYSFSNEAFSLLSTSLNDQEETTDGEQNVNHNTNSATDQLKLAAIRDDKQTIQHLLNTGTRSEEESKCFVNMTCIFLILHNFIMFFFSSKITF